MATEDGGKNSQGGVICVLPNGETQTDAELLEELTGIMAKVHVDAPSVIDAFVADISKGANQTMDDAEKEALKEELRNEFTMKINTLEGQICRSVEHIILERFKGEDGSRVQRANDRLEMTEFKYERLNNHFNEMMEKLKAEIKNEIREDVVGDISKSFDAKHNAARYVEKERIKALKAEGEEKKQVLNFRMEKTYLDILDEWAENRDIKTRTAALKAMILELGDD